MFEDKPRRLALRRLPDVLAGVRAKPFGYAPSTMAGQRLALGVILSFLTLCAAALWVTRPVPEAHAPALGPLPPAAPGPAPAAPAPTRGAVPTPGAPTPTLRGSPPGAVASAPAELTPGQEDARAAMQAVAPLVQQCFEDVAEHYPGEHTAVLEFTLEARGPGGHLRGGEVKESSVNDPWVKACILDALEEAPAPAPRGAEPVAVRFPFRYVPHRDGGTPGGR